MAQPALPHKPVANWAKLPAGWMLGGNLGVSVDKDDNVWVFNRGKHPVIEFDKTGKMIRAWNEVPVVASHGIRVDPQGFVWLIDVAGHQVLKMTADGQLVFRIGAVGGAAAADNNEKEAFNRPTGITFAPNGDFLVSDGYINSRVVKYSKDAVYLTQWGNKGTGDGQFNLVHDVALDPRGRVDVRPHKRTRPGLRFEREVPRKWTNVGAPWDSHMSTRRKPSIFATA